MLVATLSNFSKKLLITPESLHTVQLLSLNVQGGTCVRGLSQ